MTLSDGPIRQAALRIGPRAGVVLVAAVLFWLAAYLMPAGLAQLTLGLVGATLALVAIWVVVIKRAVARAALGCIRARAGVDWRGYCALYPDRPRGKDHLL